MSLRDMPPVSSAARLAGHERLWPFLFLSAVLLAILAPYVIFLMPVKSPAMKEHWVAMHQRALYYMKAQRMVEKLLPSPPLGWASPSRCGELGHGVWYADGQVVITSMFGDMVPIAWKTIYVPETSEFLYVMVGHSEQGDFRTALQRAGVNQGNP